MLHKSDLKDIITSLYTNRCLALSKLNKHDEIIEDTNYVLYHLD